VRSEGLWQFLLLFGALPGAAAALVWGLFNLDLYRPLPQA
jgi:hypothetical protein